MAETETINEIVEKEEPKIKNLTILLSLLEMIKVSKIEAEKH